MLKSLEDYIVDMENRSAMDHSQPPTEDVWTQLQQKENDLLLAAELGKALLEKNEELKKQHDAVIEDYSKKLEAVEQDRHLLKRKLANKESEFEGRILELQNDITELSNKLATKESVLKQWDRDKSNLVAELNAQNARLTSQLKEAAAVESQLQQQIECLKQECAVGKTNLHEHMSSVDTLRDELDLVTEKNKELERRLHMAAAERDSLANALEEASDRILLLERHAREQDLRYQHSLKDYSLPQEKLSVEDRLNAGEQRSLLAEMDISEPTLSQECMSVYRQLRSLVQQLKSHNDDDSGLHSDCSTTSFEENAQFSAGLLSEVAQELVGLVLDTDVVRLLERLEQARREIQERDAELARRSEKIMELSTKVSVCEVELQAAMEERDRARNDASNSSLAQEDVVIKAREDRDLAVQRKTKAEVELAKTRVELMQANSQLLEAIQQKVELSQQLEQWQMDMQELLDEQLRTKLTSQEVSMKQIVHTPVAPPRRKLLSFFLR
ncbi:bicaudal D-related protein homolog isoform X1 [Tribolium castaneum]|uniref:Bicaudal D-related protein homolog-like Protein n=1 Tax=Tribolium castaneum TaxID=7070 RepID=A0A139WGE3_TRICA|nr:PREDICTED: bicaudal D-related protein homolog isoform X1 [Tribolium castaneum]XP_008194874.1 PREDICTED: bicaudal D-related protein homolog isoform X1 [Tribolium castaneum]KYB26959.1 Bicaudal D-related protein homolog-like Protein [Tribolium castaneum]|eukprot:XP_008194873.1 PREDICTED: bicaudal D-related protein homolog isoform X1 [Tribolium castaneum]